MRMLLHLLSTVCSIYMFIIFIRIILSWFSNSAGGYGGVENFLRSITDPYLNWFRRFSFLRIGYIDISPVAAVAVLSLINRALAALALRGTLSLGILLTLTLQILWSVFSFFIGFCIVVLILRIAAFITKRNIYGSFWRIVDSISRPILYRINRIFFFGRQMNFLTGIFLSIAVLAVCGILGSMAIILLSGLLSGLPI